MSVRYRLDIKSKSTRVREYMYQVACSVGLLSLEGLIEIQGRRCAAHSIITANYISREGRPRKLLKAGVALF